MQVDRYNHLLFPRDANAGGGNNPAATGKESASTAGGTVGVQARPQPPAWGVQGNTRAASRTESVVLKIQWPDGTGTAPVDAPLYTPGRRMPAAASADANTGAMAREHQLAVDRQAGGSVTPIAVNKDGVLVVAKPPQATEPSDVQPDFVALAVSALREYRDDPERQRAAKLQASTPEAQWGALRGLQQLAAKLNVFA